MKTLAKSLEDTAKLAEDFISTLKPKAAGATIVGLYGDLGAGKTTFTQACAEALGIQETVSSPTFVIEKIYQLKNSGFSHLVHIDAYRLESGNELLRLGWKELSENPNNLILVEWPEKVAEALPDDIMKLYFTFIDEKTREITI
jgi:tRNA threonylcarbamoyladenosine biosynthesis protein TsaE